MEDNDSFRKRIIRKYLQQCDVVELPSAQRFSEIFASRDFHFILMDYQLPGSSGEELIRQVRKAGYPGAIIAISSDNGLNQRLLKSGADAAVEKHQDHLLKQTVRLALSIAEVRGDNSGCKFGN